MASLFFNDNLCDHDSTDLFCGQIPNTMSESDLRCLFEPYGRILQLNILRDKNGKSRGCCFVTYCSRQSTLNAQHALHNSMILPGMRHPIQVKPADVKNRNERKIFVGMISKSYDDDDVKQLFLPYGPIEECTVLRDVQKQSRGCAFVTFQKRQNALEAIRALHQSCTMEGCSAPINVRFADSSNDKNERRRLKKINEKNPSLFAQQISFDSMDFFSPSNISLCNDESRPKITPSLQNTSFRSFQIESNHCNGDHAENHSLLSSFTKDWEQFELIGDHCRSLRSLFDSDPNDCSSTTKNQILPSINDNLLSSTSIPRMKTFRHEQETSQTVIKLQMKQRIGPPGANLFIYHLPSEFADRDLAQTFSPFGNIISAKVFIDKLTQRSKCFGFVSYDNLYAAQQAIQQMNGFSIGGKRLKVQLKKSRC